MQRSVQDIESALVKAEERHSDTRLCCSQELQNLRVSAINEITELKEKLELANSKLKVINDIICTNFGHDFSPWEEKENLYEDRSWYYVRTCAVCGELEMSFSNPGESKNKTLVK